MLIHVKPDQIDSVWPRVGALLICAMRKGQGECDPDQLRDLLRNGRADLLVQDHARFAIALEFHNYPNYRLAHVIALAGRGALEDPAELAQLKAWCKGHGCKFLQGWTSPAVARLWQRAGLSECYRVVRAEL